MGTPAHKQARGHAQTTRWPRAYGQIAPGTILHVVESSFLGCLWSAPAWAIWGSSAAALARADEQTQVRHKVLRYSYTGSKLSDHRHSRDAAAQSSLTLASLLGYLVGSLPSQAKPDWIATIP